MEEAPLLGALTGPDDETAADLFGPERASEAECRARSPATAVPPEPDELPVLRDAYLGVAATAPGEEPPAAEDAAPPPAYSLRVLSSLLPAPLGAGVRVIPVSAASAGVAPAGVGDRRRLAGGRAGGSPGSRSRRVRGGDRGPCPAPCRGDLAPTSELAARKQVCWLGPCCHRGPGEEAPQW